jgi:hypothetical protein
MRQFRAGVTFEDLLVVIAALIGFAWGLTAISDNTALLHIRTGIDMVRNNAFPDSDPYSYTAAGEPWVLQSWLAEYVYGVLHAIWSSKLIALVNALLLGGLAAGMVRWVRTGTSWITFASAAAVLLLSIGHWSTRPTTFGFVLFFLLPAVAKRSLWWTFLIGALWVNTHGSWPVGMLWLGGVAVGTLLDERKFSLAPFRQFGVLTAAVIVGGVVNPVGWKLLTFPLTAVQKGDVFAEIAEWRSPNFHGLGDISSYGPLIGIVVAVMLLVQLRVSWKHLLPFAGLLAMSLYSSRNLPMLAIGLASVLGIAYHEFQLRKHDVIVNSVTRRWGPVEVFCIAVMAFVAVLQTGRLVAGPDYELSQYPVAGISYAKQLGYFTEGKRVLAPDYVGCYLILQDGKGAGVFIDDRYDMYPEQVSKDLFKIIDIDENTHGLLDKYDVEAVLWRKDGTLANHLATQPDWEERWKDKDWVLLTHKSG